MSSFIKTNSGLSVALVAMTIVSVAAVAQTGNSPFAHKKKKQAWESDAARPSASTPAYQAPSYQAPRYMPPPGYGPNSGDAHQNSASTHQNSASTQKSAPVDAYAPASTLPQNAPQSYVTQSSSSRTVNSGQYSSSAPAYAPPPPPAKLNYSGQNYSGQNQSGQTAPSQSYSAQTYSAPSYSGQNTGTYNPPAQSPFAPSRSIQNSPAQSGVAQPDLLPGYRPRGANQAGAYYPGREDKGGFSVPAHAQRGQYAQNSYSAPSPYPPQHSGPYSTQNQSRPQAQNPYGQNNSQGGWKDKLSRFGNFATTLRGYLKLGAAAVQRKAFNKDGAFDDGWGGALVADAMVAGEVSAITQGGLEYGVGAELRGQYDKYRRGFGGRVGNCGVGVVNVQGCNSLIVGGLAQPLRGHTSQFYNAGLDNSKAGEFALEGAYLFLRSAYGDVTVGRDDGAAYLFSLGAPTLMAVNASNSPVDYTGLDSATTVNNASGFAEKIAYVSPRLLGDTIGLGVQFGASYAPNARACGVDYCVRSNGKDGSTALSPDLKNVIELGLALDRKFDNGLSIEATASYAMASEDSGFIGFDNLRSYGLGLEGKYGPWTLGGSFLSSNNGLQDGDYEAYDIGLTWKPRNWGVSANYAHATDKNVNLLSDQATLGFIYDFERFTVGTGVQYIERDVIGLNAGLIGPSKEKATALFVEGAVKF